MILYHYCSTDVFFQIMTKKRIWLSSLGASNDSHEGKLLSRVVDEMCRARGLSAPALLKIKEDITALEQVFDAVGFCLSEQGDLLSQWRGYAADGAGVSIGFRSEFFEDMKNPDVMGFPYRLMPVLYEAAAQRARLAPLIDRIANLEREGFMRPTLVGYDDQRYATYEDALHAFEERARAIHAEVSGMWDSMYLLKNAAFEEEREWRLFGEIVPGVSNTLFRVRGNALVPYHELVLPPTFGDKAIAEIILGPKNPTPIKVVEGFLGAAKVRCEVLRASEATYR